MQSPLIEPDYNIPIAYLSDDVDCNKEQLMQFIDKWDEVGRTRDIFLEDFIWKMIETKAVPDLNLYRY